MNPSVTIVGADTEGSVYTGDDPRPYLTEGIGEDFWPETFDPALVDRWVRVPDREAFLTARAVTRQEGILIGGSGGSAVVRGARRRARLRRGRHDRRAAARHRPAVPVEALLRLVDAPVRLPRGARGRHASNRCSAPRGTSCPPLITVLAHDKVRQAVDLLQTHGISQAPVVREESTDVAQFVGSIRDRELLERVFRDPDALQADVAEVMAPPIPSSSGTRRSTTRSTSSSARRRCSWRRRGRSRAS